jgi:hypothetical protein
MHTALAQLIAAVLAAPSQVKVALVPLAAGEGIADKTAASLTEAVASQIRKQPGILLITQSEITSLLSHERQKSLLGCQTDSCLAEIGGALGVARLATGDVAKLGTSFLLNLKLLDVNASKVLAQATRRHKGGSLDDVLDSLPGAVGELFGAAPPPASVSSRSASESPGGAAALPPNTADEPLDVAAFRSKLRLARIGPGRFVAYLEATDIHNPVFAGDGKVFYAQRVFGGSSDKSAKTFDQSFWEPREKGPRSGFRYRPGELAVSCGEKTVALTPVASAEAAAIVAGAKFFKPRWQRRVHALAHDDSGTYYVVDRAREPADSQDYRLYVGKKKKLEHLPLSDAIVDHRAASFVAVPGTLSFAREADGTQKTFWVRGEQRAPLTAMDVEMSARLVYTDLGVYAEQALGTLCDGVL